ncbi:MAG: 30S ribosomal protein S12 methylthiotransferase RimO [Clostridiales bacterium]|nr:30S ribosomal protein S12 methylthiotransferase RimO [Clostridiales bacterium]
MIDFTEKKFGIISLGCDKNRVDTEKLLSIIRGRGCEITDDISAANVIIVNTCAFLNESRKEAIETVLECSAYKSGNLEKLVVCGCLPQKYAAETFPELVEADVFLGVNDYGNFFSALEKSYNGERVNFVGSGNGGYLPERVVTTPAHYAYLKIADGCNNHCTYCLIPKIRGAYKSYPMEELISEAEGLGEVSELVLVAQDITRYGIDLYGQKKLKEILQKLTALVNINSVRLLYCYPDMLDDELIAEIRDNPKIVKYLDIPLQHSEDRILKLMNRPKGRAEYLSLIKKLRKNIPDIAIRSTFIAGFPSETEEEFEGLCNFLREAELDNCGFFAYSREPDTAAYKLKGQINYPVKKSRVKKLYEVQKEISRKKMNGLIGKKLRVLCDGIDYDNNCFVGRAYFQAPDIDGKVYFNAHSAAQGEYLDILVERTDGYDLFGRTEDYNL